MDSALYLSKKRWIEATMLSPQRAILKRLREFRKIGKGWLSVLEILERILQRVSQSFNSDYLIRRKSALPVLPLMCQELLDGNRAGIGYKATFSAEKIRWAIRTSIRFRGAPSGAIRPLKVHASGMRDR